MASNRNVLGFLVLLFWTCATLAAATTQSVTGAVQLRPAQGVVGPLANGQRVESGATITTGDNSSAILRFDDGQTIALVGNTTFTVIDYKFNPHQPKEGSFVASLARGAVRAVTGIIGEANKQNVSIKTATATMGIRGTDFSLHYDTRLLYIQVFEGAVSATNEAGVGIFDAAIQPLGMVASPGTQPQAIQPGDLSPAARASFRQLEGMAITGRERGPSPRDPSCGDRR